jgi:putative ABC transport system substrate-binding protein
MSPFSLKWTDNKPLERSAARIRSLAAAHWRRAAHQGALMRASRCYRWRALVLVLLLLLLLFAPASLVALPGAAAPAQAAQAGKVYKIGFLRAGEPPTFWIDEFREGLRELGYVEGQNVLIEFRIGALDQLPRLAEDLVRSKVDVIVASASSAGMAAKNATTSIPIVFTSLSHPVEIGLIKSLARPGGNITGVTVNAGATVTKRLELLRELVPSLKQVAVLTHPAHPTDPVQRKEVEEAARALGLQLKPAAVRAPEDFEAAFKAVSGAGGLLNIDTPLFTTYRTQFVELAARNRLPAIWSNGIIVEAGGLMSCTAPISRHCSGAPPPTWTRS